MPRRNLDKEDFDIFTPETFKSNLEGFNCKILPSTEMVKSLFIFLSVLRLKISLRFSGASLHAVSESSASIVNFLQSLLYLVKQVLSLTDPEKF